MSPPAAPQPDKSPGPTRILLVEDDDGIATGLALNLRLEQFDTEIARDGEEGLARILEGRPDIVLLDISLPKRSGLEVLAEIRSKGDTTPVIILSARQDEFDKVAALRSGADDYVTKPFGVAELLARIEAVLRRLGARADAAARPADEDASDPPLVCGPLEIDVEAREVRRAGAAVALTKLEFELLHFLASRPQKVFSREQLLQRVWGVNHSGSPRTVDNFIAQLRAKLEADPAKPRQILTVRGDGYRFVAQPD